MKNSFTKWVIGGLAALVFLVGGLLFFQSRSDAEAWRILEVEKEAGLDFAWEHVYPDWLRTTCERFHLQSFSRPRLWTIGIDYEMKDPERLAWAVRRVGQLRQLRVAQGDPEKVAKFLRGLGKQPEMENVQIFHVLLGEELGEILPNWPRLREAGLAGTRYSGARFAELKWLENLDVSFSPLTDEGLEAILRCPALRNLYTKDSKITESAVRVIPDWRRAALKHIRLSNLNVTEERAKVLTEELTKTCPDVEVEIIPL